MWGLSRSSGGIHRHAEEVGLLVGVGGSLKVYTVENEFWEFKVLSLLFGLQVSGDCRAGMLRLSPCAVLKVDHVREGHSLWERATHVGFSFEGALFTSFSNTSNSSNSNNSHSGNMVIIFIVLLLVTGFPPPNIRRHTPLIINTPLCGISCYIGRI